MITSMRERVARAAGPACGAGPVRGLFRGLAPVLALVLALAGCGGSPVPTAAEMTASYERALERTAPAAVELPGGEAGVRDALARAEAMFADPAPDAVRTRAAAAYAPDAYLNDNLAVVEGSAAIADYFAHSMARVSALGVTFLDVTHAGPDYFVRWRMTVRSPRLNDGAPMVSYGMTHFRFDAAGRILVHRDFWDAGTGLYEYVPGLGGVLRSVRARAAGDPGENP